MGMFDTFHIQDCGRQLAVQSKQFAQVLGEYRLGDFVDFKQAVPSGVATWSVGHQQYRSPHRRNSNTKKTVSLLQPIAE